MATRISVYDNASFSELEWKRGKLFAVDNTDPESPQPFLLGIPERIERGFQPGGIGLLFDPSQSHARETWTLFPRGNVLAFMGPNYDGKNQIAWYTHQSPGHFVHKPYALEFAYCGEEDILHALEDRKQGLEFYDSIHEREYLITERTSLGDIMEHMGMGCFLPHVPRIR